MEPHRQTWDTVQVVRFYIGTQQCALDIMKVKEIINPLTIVPIPHSPELVEGVVELRGAFLPVVDMRKRFGTPAAAPTRESKYVVAMLDSRYIALIVDRVLDVRRIALRDIDEAPALARGEAARFVAGLAKWDDEIALFLDLQQLFSDVERQALLHAAPA